MAVVPAGKKGHHSDFALSQDEIREVVDFISDRRTRAMFLLAGLGMPVRGIVNFKSTECLLQKEDHSLWLEVPDHDMVPLTPKQWQLLMLFPYGFDVTNVTIWRRIKRALLAAREAGILNFDDNHIPYPQALATKPTEELPPAHDMIVWALTRIHDLQSRMPNQDVGTTAQCPHKDCERLRKWLARKLNT